MNEQTTKKETIAIWDATNFTEEDSWAWEDFVLEVKTLLKKVKKFYVEGRNMGWRSLSGYAIIETDNGNVFIQKVTPNTNDFTIEIYKSEKEGAMFDMTIYHHDAPTGEYRTVYAYSKAKKMGLIKGKE